MTLASNFQPSVPILNMKLCGSQFFVFKCRTINLQGERGLDGIPGQPGLPCGIGTQYASGSLMVRHSQSTIVPRCEQGTTKLWDGYSLLYLEGNENAHHQDLGEFVILIGN